ncbi:MAG: Crp/Fnr family transcriptional regulator [Terriglobia bacterium]|jgi:CRP-like cAMP-binding protein
MANNGNLIFNSKEFFKRVRTQKTTEDYQNQQPIFSQGDAADAMFYIQSGYVKLSVVSQRGKKAIVAVLGRGDFFGECCLTERSSRTSTATAIDHTTIARVNKGAILRIIQQEPAFARLFIAYLLSRVARIEAAFEDQLFNSSEQRLARILLLLAHFGPDSTSETVLLKISQASLAQMVGTTRSRVSHFMNKFRTLGFIDYTGNGGLTVNSGLPSVLLDV